MEKLTMEQRVKINEFYIENQLSIVLIQSIHALLPGQESPAKPAGRVVQRFQRQKNVGDLPRRGGGSGEEEPGSVPTQENTERAPQRFQGALGHPGHDVLQSLETHDFLAAHASRFTQRPLQGATGAWIQDQDCPAA